MKNLDAFVDEWRGIAAQLLDVDAIKTHPGLQFRSIAAVPTGEQYRKSRESASHVLSLRDAATVAGKDLEAILVAQIEGELWVVDGHHRLDAYRKLGRPIPARVMVTDMARAAALAMVANFTNVKLPLHKDQARECAWQYMAWVTLRGKVPHAAVSSIRKTQARFPIVGRGSIERMANAVGSVKPSEYVGGDRNPLTHWPTWRAVTKRKRPEPDGPEPTRATRLEKKATKFAMVILKMQDENSEALSLAMAKLRDGFRDDTLGSLDEDRQAELAELEEAMSPVEDF